MTRPRSPGRPSSSADAPCTDGPPGCASRPPAPPGSSSIRNPRGSRRPAGGPCPAPALDPLRAVQPSRGVLAWPPLRLVQPQTARLASAPRRARQSRASVSAADSPVKPEPTTATSTSMSPLTGPSSCGGDPAVATAGGRVVWPCPAATPADRRPGHKAGGARPASKRPCGHSSAHPCERPCLAPCGIGAAAASRRAPAARPGAACGRRS